MFTGIVELSAKVAYKDAHTLTLERPASFDDIKEGASICVSGACLSITKFDQNTMSFDIHEETWKKTNFHALMVGSLVNLERSMQLSDRLDGHMVQGHVEAVGVVRSMQALPLAPDGSSTGAILVCTVPDQLRHLLVPKGSVAINGVSLTIAEKIDHNNCSIALIPHTLAVTNLGSIKEGDLLNIETDILGRYVSAMLKHYPLPS